MLRKLGVAVACAVAVVVVVQGAAGDSGGLGLTPGTFSLDGGTAGTAVVTSGWGGQVLHFQGTATDTTGPLGVTVGSQPCVTPPTLTASGSAFSVDCVLPVLSGSNLTATVTLGSQSATSTDTVTAPGRPAVDRVSGCVDDDAGGTGSCPTNGGMTLTLTGSGFTPQMVALVGGRICANLPYIGATTRSCILPAGSGTEPLTIVTSTGPVETGLTVGYAGAVSTPLAAPTGVTATAGDGEATVGWSTAADPTATAFRVTPSTPSGALPATTYAVPANGPPATMSAVVTGLANGVQTTFTVAAVAGSQVGAESASTAPIVPSGLPGAPSSPSARARLGGAVTVTWGAPDADGGSPVTGYTVTAYRDGSAKATVPATGTSAQLKLPTGVYVFVVTATNANGSGPASAPSAPVVVLGFGR